MPTTADDILVRTIMQGSTGLATDRYVNDWAFRWLGAGSPTNTDLTNLLACVDLFYNDTGAGGFSVSDFISEAVDRGVTHEMEFYSISAGGSPLLSLPWLGPAAPAVDDNNLPTEVSAVLSFHGTLTNIQEETGATRPRARRRGRVYVGPLTVPSIGFGTPNPFLNGSLLTAMREGAGAMADLADINQFQWSVWSRADDELYEVVGGWTDNAPDVQRRRGVESTARVTFTH